MPSVERKKFYISMIVSQGIETEKIFKRTSNGVRDGYLRLPLQKEI